MSDWIYYNHAAMLKTEPHESLNTNQIIDKKTWRNCRGPNGEKPLFAVWTSNYDCGYETGWWYCIKDDLFEISALSSKKRYNITRGNKFFEIKIIKPSEYQDELLNVQIKAYSSYSNSYKPRVDENQFKKTLTSWEKEGLVVFAAFCRETKLITGYLLIEKNSKKIGLNVLKVIPEYEGKCVNAALIYAVLEHYQQEVMSGSYFSNGSRTINHVTQFDEYLKRLFEFRYAYCELNIAYRPVIKLVVKILYVWKWIFKRLDHKKNIFHLINSLLKMEEIVRRQKMFKTIKNRSIKTGTTDEIAR